MPDRSQQLMDGPSHTSTHDKHRHKLDTVASSATNSSLPQKRKRRAAEKEREREKEAAKSAPPAKVCGWYTLSQITLIYSPHRKRNTLPLRISHLYRTILNILLQAHPPLVELSIILYHRFQGHLLTMKLIFLIE